MILRRDGSPAKTDEGQERMLASLYGNAAGRALLKILTKPSISDLAGKFLSTRLSRIFIGPFIRKNGIDMSQFEKGPFNSYNEFFSRRIADGARPIDTDPDHLISPCDSKLTVVRIDSGCHLKIKNTEYTVESLLKDGALAGKYFDGAALIFRLTVDDYHRYCYPADGEKSEQRVIRGVLHTVNPVANDRYPIYKENSREYCLMATKEFGDVIMMEVGALLVGRIVNHHGAASIKRGEEKGYFQFGGSTIVLLIKKDAAVIDSDIILNSSKGIETIVKMGEKIGVSVRK